MNFDVRDELEKLKETHNGKLTRADFNKSKINSDQAFPSLLQHNS